MKKLLNVGAGSRQIELPSYYDDFEWCFLDIDPRFSPDILCDARDLTARQPAQFDAVLCSHNLEHYHRHEVPRMLAGFLHVLKPDGFAHVLVPDLWELMRTTVEHRLDVEDVVYQSPAGPITVLDVIYGFGAEIESSGQDFFAHKTGFTAKSLMTVLYRAGFMNVYTATANLQIEALAFRNVPDAETRKRFRLPADG